MAEKLVHIQALRALAVTSVILFHIDPRYSKGGFVGVDIFFAISGWLMTSSIRNLWERHANPREVFVNFYLRRLTRLLPAALTVLMLTVIAVLLTQSRMIWRENALQAISSVFFVENWRLVAIGNDYLGAHAGSAVQHYWSLSVEEQFYLIWPLILVALLSQLSVHGVGQKKINRCLIIAVLSLSTASYIYAIVQVQWRPEAAYYDTLGRFYELSLGGGAQLCAPFLRRSRIGSPIIWHVIGGAFLLFALFFYSSTMPFPGAIAIVPVMGTVMILVWGGVESSNIAERLLQRLYALKPIQWIGDRSYSLYLVHVPVFVLIGGGPKEKLLELTLIALIAVVLKRFVEDRYRLTGFSVGNRTSDNRVESFKIISGAGFLALSISIIIFIYIDRDVDEANHRLQRFEAADYSGCAIAISRSIGTAGEICGSAKGVKSSDILPSPLIAAFASPSHGCQLAITRSNPIECSFGINGGPKIILVGDSHAAHWLPALIPWARSHKINLTTYLMSGCPLTKKDKNINCVKWNKAVLEKIQKERPVAIIVSARSARTKGELNERVQGIIDAWREIPSGIKVVAIRDIPQPVSAGIDNQAECVLSHKNFEECAFSENRATSLDVVGPAARGFRNVSLIDMNRFFCDRGRCPAVIGKFLVYTDYGHMSPQYSQLLSYSLGENLDPVVQSIK